MCGLVGFFLFYLHILVYRLVASSRRRILSDFGLQPFSESAQRTAQELQELEATREKKFKTLAAFLGEEKPTTEELFGMVHTFASQFEVR